MRLRQVRVDGRIENFDVSSGRFDFSDGFAEGDLVGGMVTPLLAEPHVHLDAVLLGARAPNRSGTLREGIRNWAMLREQLTEEDVRARALEVVGWYVRQGTLKIRTHVDTGCPVAVRALLQLRAELAQDQSLGCPELQVVAFPQEGILTDLKKRKAWEEAVHLGCDAVGAIPHFERSTEEGWASVRLAFALAEKHGLRVDLHCDETDDPGSRNLEVAAVDALDRGMGDRTVAGHCTALHSYPNPYAAKVIEWVARSGILVVCNPLDNSVLQGRYDNYPRRRGLTRGGPALGGGREGGHRARLGGGPLVPAGHGQPAGCGMARRTSGAFDLGSSAPEHGALPVAREPPALWRPAPDCGGGNR